MQFFTALLAFVAVASAAPAVLEERAATVCGSTSYTANEVTQAGQKACSMYKAGTLAKNYPHIYKCVSHSRPKAVLTKPGTLRALTFLSRALIWSIPSRSQVPTLVVS